MSSHRRGNDVWIIERRGCVLWWRWGRDGNRGRISHREYASEVEAQAALDAELDVRRADGWQPTEHPATVDGPLIRGSASSARSISTASARVMPRDLAADLDGRLATAAVVSEAVDAWLVTCGRRVTAKLSRLAVEIGPRRRIKLAATFAEGEGSNFDAYDFETIAVDAVATWSGELDDVIELDRFQDHAPWQLSQADVIARFRDALGHNASWRAVAALPVRELRVRYFDDFIDPEDEDLEDEDELDA